MVTENRGTAGRSEVAAKVRGRPANASSAETMALVLGAARRLFAAHGYAATSNRMIADGAGLAHTAIYNHFGSKARLFTAVFLDVQQQLTTELERSVASAPDEAPFPRALFDAIEALRAADPSCVDFLASMYVEVRRDAELRDIFQSGERFPIVDTIRSLAERSGAGLSGMPDDDSTWFWITFALGLAQVGALADSETFTATVATFRRQFRSVDNPEAQHPLQPKGPRP